MNGLLDQDAMNHERLRWLDTPQPTAASCLVCGNKTGNRVILLARHWNIERGFLEFATCGACESGFYPDADAHEPYPEAEDQKLENPEFLLLLYHYLEFGCGLDVQVGLLERLPYERFRSTLEIGCNMGIALDYCRTMWQVETAGLEPSAYGMGGAKLLEQTIVHRYLEDAPEIMSRTFDLIYASEVLEHVRRPGDLLTSIRRRLTERGVALLTTPAMESVSRTAPLEIVLGSLSAGAHYFVASSKALAALLRSARFERFRIARSGTSHVVIGAARAASFRRRPRDLLGRLNQYYLRKTTRSYAEPRVELSFLMHAYDTSVALGRERQAAELLPRIDGLLESLFGIDLADPVAVVKKLSGADDIFALGRAIPYALPRHLRARAQSREGDRARRRGELEALAARIAVQGLRADMQNFPGYVKIYRRAADAARGLVWTQPEASTARALLAEAEVVAASIGALGSGRGIGQLWMRAVAARILSAGARAIRRMAPFAK